jgi:hypothetical protein
MAWMKSFDLPRVLKWKANPSFAMVAGDNCAYFYHASQHRTDYQSHLLHTVNWIEIFPEEHIELQSKWTKMNGTKQIECIKDHILLFEHQRTLDVNQWWFQVNLWIDKHQHLLEHPSPTKAQSKTHFVIQRPLLNCNLASAIGIERFVDVLFRRYRVQEQKDLVVLFGDEQLVKSLYSRIAKSPEEYFWLLPFPAEGHLLMHLTMAIYEVFGPLLLTLAEKMNWTALSPHFNLKEWTKHEDFLLITI